MDYLKNYKNIIKKESTILKEFIVETLKNEKNNGRPFEKALTNLQNLFYEKFNNQSILSKHLSYFEPMYNDLIHHRNNYDPTIFDSMFKTLEIEIHKKYLSVIETFRTYSIDPDFSENMSYEKFYPEILKYFLYKRVYNRLDKSIFHLTEAIKLFFEIDNYSDFKTSFLIDESEKVTELKIQNIFKKYGRKYVPLIKEEFKNISPKIKKNSSDIEKFTATFSDNDKIILLHLSLNFANNIPMTERIKLIILTGSIADHSIFTEKSDNNTFYKKVNQGLKYRFSDTEKKLSVDNILSVIEGLNLPITENLLKSIKRNNLKEK